jgi:hypothetical protein
MTQQFHFDGITAEPVPSLLRDFSAPVILDFAYTPEQLTLLLAHESDPFNAWEAGQRLASQLILDATAAIAAGQTPVWPESFVAAARRLLANPCRARRRLRRRSPDPARRIARWPKRSTWSIPMPCTPPATACAGIWPSSWPTS